MKAYRNIHLPVRKDFYETYIRNFIVTSIDVIERNTKLSPNKILDLIDVERTEHRLARFAVEVLEELINEISTIHLELDLVEVLYDIDANSEKLIVNCYINKEFDTIEEVRKFLSNEVRKIDKHPTDIYNMIKNKLNEQILIFE